MHKTPPLQRRGKRLLITGVILGYAALALLVNVLTGDGSVWAYMLPIGIASATAIGAGLRAQTQAEDGA